VCICVCVRVCVCVCLCALMCVCLEACFHFFPGQGNHVLKIGIIRFMTQTKVSKYVTQKLLSDLERETKRERDRERERIDIYSLLNVFTL